MKNFSQQRILSGPVVAPASEITSVLNQGLAFHQAGLLTEAAQLYRTVLQASPRNFDATHLLGVVFHQQGEHGEAVRHIDLALKINPKSPAPHNNRGNALKALGRLEEAVKSYDQAIRLKPDYVEAFSNRGDALSELKRYEEALASCDAAIRLKPDHAEAHNNRGVALLGMKRFGEALACYERAIALRPNHAEALNNRGDALNKLNEPFKAIANFEEAISLRPDFAMAHNNRGIAWQLLKRFDEALENYDQAIALKPDLAEAFNNRGKVLCEMKRLDEALASYESASKLKPDLQYLMGDRLHTKMQLCDWSDFEGDCGELVAAIRNGHLASVPMPLLATPAGPSEQFDCARLHVANECPASPAPRWRGERYAHERIKLAYVSGDLREHPVAALTAGLFEHHDRARFETIAISLGGGASDRMTDRLKAAFEQFINVQGKSDQQIAALLRQLEIDIAVDLSGFTGDARPGIFTARPAPVQVNYLGFAGTMGSSAWDYIVADRFVIPNDCQEQFAEKVVYLPGSFMATDDSRTISPTPSRKDAGLPEHGFVFCCFNNSNKLTPDLFDIWMRLLREVEASVLWLSSPPANAMRNLRAEATKRGVAAERLIFAPRVASNEDHLARLQLADLFLDTLYYNAHTTACDALWAGLPIVTHPGRTFASRVAGGLLHAVGLPELIAPSREAYELLALGLARDEARLGSIKRKLAACRENCPLFDTARFTRNIEAAYTSMWERAQAGDAPLGFAI